MAPHAQPVTVPPLAPSVENAYHDKCKELRLRTKEVEDANDASRIRLDRMKRQVFKLRLERAFLLEQLARRTSTNVEDSDGSPSPGPAPEDKPLRSKRGHRKSSVAADPSVPGGAGSHTGGFFSDKLAGTAATASPAPSDSFKGPNGSGMNAATPSTNGAIANTAASISLRPPRRPAEPFDLYVSEMRPVAAKPRGSAAVTSATATPRSGTPKLGASSTTPPKTAKSADADADADEEDEEVEEEEEEELVRGWKDLSDKERHEYEARHEREMEQYEKEQEVYASAQKPKAERDSKPDDEDNDDDNDDGADDDEDDDVEMGHDDDDDDDDAVDPDETLADDRNS